MTHPQEVWFYSRIWIEVL